MQTPTPSQKNNRPPTATLIQRYVDFWQSGDLARACELVDRHFDQLPDPAPLRVAIAHTLIAHDYTHDAIAILQLTFQHYANSGYFFHALQVYYLLAEIDEPQPELVDRLWTLYGNESTLTTWVRSVPNFPEPTRQALDLSEDSEITQDFSSLTDQFLILFLRDAAKRKRTLLQEPRSLPRLPLFSALSQSRFHELLELLQVSHISTMGFLDSMLADGLTWTIGRNFWLTSDKDAFSIPTGTLFGLAPFSATRFYPQFKVASRSADVIRLSQDALELLSESWPEFPQLLSKIAMTSILEARLTHHKLLNRLPTDLRELLIKNMELKRFSEGELLNPEGEEPVLILLLNGIIQLGTKAQALGDSARMLKAPNVAGACALGIERVGYIELRAITDVIVAIIDAQTSRELVDSDPEISMLLVRLANRRLQELSL